MREVGRADPVQEWAARTPGRTALVEYGTGRRWSYAELSDLGDAWGAVLDESGVEPGDRVATLLGNRVEHVALFLACGRRGAALVPLNWRLAPGEVGPILRDAIPRVLFTDAHYASLAAAAGPPCPVMDVDGVDTRGTPDASTLAPAAEDALLVLYTSGSTGRPKGAVLSHRQVEANARATVEGWGLGPDDAAPVTTPLFHTGGWNVFATPLWWAGGTVVLLDGFDPQHYLAALAQEGCSHALAVPTQLHMLAQAPAWGRPLPALRALVSGGAPCPASLADAVRRAGYPFKEGYGLTECGPNCFAQTVEESARRPGWVGRPVPGLSVRLVGKGGAVVAGPGQGELCLRGPQLFSGYLNDPERTAEVVDAEGWLHTGDVAERDAEGHYRICGRIKEMFISGGENVYPGEVEAALLDHPAIAEVAVVGVPDEKWGEVGQAFVVLHQGAGLTPQALRRFARGCLAAYKVPKVVTLLPALPRLGSGKVDRAALARNADPAQVG